MSAAPLFVVQSYRRKGRSLTAGDQFSGANEDAIFKRGRAMQDRVSGLVFFKIETSSEGDIWDEVEVLAVTGDVPKCG